MRVYDCNGVSGSGFGGNRGACYGIESGSQVFEDLWIGNDIDGVRGVWPDGGS